MAAHLKGLAGRIEEVNVVAADVPDVLIEANPLGRVPTLVMQNGVALYDSRVICEALDAMAEGPHLIPPGQARLAVLRAQALGDGICDSAVPLYKMKLADKEAAKAAEKAGEAHEPNPHMAYLSAQTLRGVDAIGPILKSLPSEVTLGHLALAAALGYLDYRHADLKWRDRNTEAMSWYLRFAERDEMRATQPKN